MKLEAFKITATVGEAERQLLIALREMKKSGTRDYLGHSTTLLDERGYSSHMIGRTRPTYGEAYDSLKKTIRDYLYDPRTPKATIFISSIESIWITASTGEIEPREETEAVAA